MTFKCVRSFAVLGLLAIPTFFIVGCGSDDGSNDEFALSEGDVEGQALTGLDDGCFLFAVSGEPDLAAPDDHVIGDYNPATGEFTWDFDSTVDGDLQSLDPDAIEFECDLDARNFTCDARIHPNNAVDPAHPDAMVDSSHSIQGTFSEDGTSATMNVEHVLTCAASADCSSFLAANTGFSLPCTTSYTVSFDFEG